MNVLSASCDVGAIFLVAASAAAESCEPPPFHLRPGREPDVSVEVVATGLHDPRGLAFGPGNELFVSEAGTTVGVFVPPPPPAAERSPDAAALRGVLAGRAEVPGYSGRVSRIDRRGQTHVVAEGMPSARRID